MLIGFDADVLSRAGLGAAMGQDPVLQIAGGHKPDGSEQAALNMTKLTAGIAELTAQVTSFAVVGHFATRNPRHEQAVRDYLSQTTGLPVTCSHELSDLLGGPRRALTTVLNARLIGLLEQADQSHYCPNGEARVDSRINGSERGWHLVEGRLCPHTSG